MTTTFDRLWYRLGLNDDDLSVLQKALMTNPKIGDIIQGTNGARKMRFALTDTGKSSGIRIIYVDISQREQSYLLLCYPKNKQDDLTVEQRKQIRALINALKGA